VRTVLWEYACLDDPGSARAHLSDAQARTEIEPNRAAVGSHDNIVGRDVAVQEALAVLISSASRIGADDPIQFLLRRWSDPRRLTILRGLTCSKIITHVGGRVRLEHARYCTTALMPEQGSVRASLRKLTRPLERLVCFL